jgi:hypothetical protein
MVTRSAALLHAHVECRSSGTGWWRYARLSLTPDPFMYAMLGYDGSPSRSGYHDDDLVPALGAPIDLSPEVRDEFTWRVTGDWASSHEERTVSPEEARRWLESGMSESYPTREPFRRVTDPAWEGATFLDSRELHRVLTAYEGQTDDLVPAAYCALAAMMDELERDFDVRVVLWFEPLRAPLPGDTALDERRRAIALASRTHKSHTS